MDYRFENEQNPFYISREPLLESTHQSYCIPLPPPLPTTSPLVFRRFFLGQNCWNFCIILELFDQIFYTPMLKHDLRPHSFIQLCKFICFPQEIISINSVVKGTPCVFFFWKIRQIENYFLWFFIWKNSKNWLFSIGYHLCLFIKKEEKFCRSYT